MNTSKENLLSNKSRNVCTALVLAVGSILTLGGCGSTDGDPPGTGAGGGGSYDPTPISCDTLDDPQGDDDDDGRTNCEEVEGYEISVDTLGFGTDSDRAEVYRVTSSPDSADTDNDGMDDLLEFRMDTDPRDPDTDDDGLTDGDEVNRWNTIPTTVDSDGDATLGALNPKADLWDGNELHLIADPNDAERKIPGPGATDPNDPDTDGDGKNDLDELNDAHLNAVVADLPSLRLELSEDPEIWINVTYNSGSVLSDSFGTSLARESTEELTKSDSTSTALSSELSSTISSELATTIGGEVTVGVEATASVFPPGVSASVNASVSVNASATNTNTRSGTSSNGISNTRAVELTSSVASTLGEELKREKALEQSQGKGQKDGSILVTAAFTNDSNIPYTVADVDILVKRYDAVASRMITVASLDLPEEGFTLKDGDPPHEVLFQSTDLPVDVVREFLANPSALFFEASSPELEDQNGVNLDFIDASRRKTALIIIDSGEGEPTRLRVATDVDRTDDGELAGIPLVQALDNAGVNFEVDVNTADKEVFTSIEGLSYEEFDRDTQAPDLQDPDGHPGPRFAKRFWVVFGPDADRDASDILLHGQDEIRLVYVKDEDRDGVFDREEFLHGSSDQLIDSDGDGLSDFFEIKVGWDLGWEQPSERVFSSPATANTDGDFATDRREFEHRTNPRLYEGLYVEQDSAYVTGAVLRFHNDVQSREACERICTQSTDCAGYTYLVPDKICEEKGGTSFVPTNNEWMSGVRLSDEFTLRENSYSQGAVLRSTNDVADISNCHLICQRNADCRSFTYLAAAKVCEEKNGTGQIDVGEVYQWHSGAR